VIKGLFGIPVLSDWQAGRLRQSLVPLVGSQPSGSVSLSTAHAPVIYLLIGPGLQSTGLYLFVFITPLIAVYG
jgi:hypothetical protein